MQYDRESLIEIAVYIVPEIFRSEHFLFFFNLSSCSAEMKPRIEIFMLKLDCGENFVMFGHSGHKLQRFEDLVFTIHLYGI